MAASNDTADTEPEPDQTAEPAPRGTAEKPTKDTDDCLERLANAEDQRRRALADLENLQKRFQRELARGQAAERERSLGALVATVDDLERAIDHARSDDDPLVSGIRAIIDTATTTIASLGYPRFGEPGDRFDPQIHEVVSTLPAGAGTDVNTVVAVIRPGYGGADRVLRAASVIVAKADE